VQRSATSTTDERAAPPVSRSTTCDASGSCLA
jgi:hypothetical protein